MKKIYFLALSLIGLLASCTNDDVEVYEDNTIIDVDVTVSLSEFFSGYNYNDTKHDIRVSEDYRTFHSEGGGYIHVRTLFYDANGVLVDSLVWYTENTNPVKKTIKMAKGTYTVISMLSFASKNNGDQDSWFWALKDRKNLASVVAYPQLRMSKWSIMSCEAKPLTVVREKKNEIHLTPTPVGSLGYLFFENFQYKNEATRGTVADNGIRELSVFAREIADGYRLNPNADEKYVYRNDAGADSWYYLSSNLEPQDFDRTWTFFKTNLYSYYYILSPKETLCFGYVLDGESTFHAYGENFYNIESGKVYLSYWDYFQVGNPYFGIADNSHWHSYSSSAREAVFGSSEEFNLVPWEEYK